eukprot:3558540-Prymnesium_polylepis.1
MIHLPKNIFSRKDRQTHSSEQQLFDAVRKGRAKDVETLLQSNTVDCVNAQAETPLHVAVGSGDDTIVSMLLCAGAPIYVSNAHHHNVLHAAAIGGHRRVMELLLMPRRRTSADAPQSSRVSFSGPYDQVTAALTALDEDRRTPLHLAAIHGRDTIGALLDACRRCAGETAAAALDAADSHGRTALMVLAEAGEAELLQACLDAGASIAPVDYNEQTAYSLAAEEGHTEVLRLLDLQAINVDLRGQSEAQLQMTFAYMAHMQDADNAFSILCYDMLTPCFPAAAGVAIKAALQCAAAAKSVRHHQGAQDVDAAYRLELLGTKAQLAAAALLATLNRRQQRELWATHTGHEALELACRTESRLFVCTPALQIYLREQFFHRLLSKLPAAGLFHPLTLFTVFVALPLNLLLLPFVAIAPPLQDRLLSWSASWGDNPIALGVEWQAFFVLHVPAV